MNVVYGINPVNELLKTDISVNSIHILSDKKNKFKQILDIAKSKNINIKQSDKNFFNKYTGSSNHQGVIAFLDKNPNPIIHENDLYELDENDITLLLLDGITDPHNLGAILRSADVFGIYAVILPKDKSACINDTVYKTSSGAAFYVPTCTVTNLVRTVERLKENGFWIYALDKENGIDLHKEKFSSKRVIVVGSEGKGIKRLLKEKCDITLTIPMAGHVDSLNASNACAITLYEIFSRFKTN